MDLTPLSDDEKANFQALVNKAIESRSDTAPESPSEFDIYCDNHYNIHMFLKGEWVNVGLNVTPLTGTL